MAQYGVSEYNESKYNTDTRLLFMTETQSMSEATLVKQPSDVLLESVFMSTAVSPSITNKALAETVKLGTWLEIKRHPGENPW